YRRPRLGAKPAVSLNDVVSRRGGCAGAARYSPGRGVTLDAALTRHTLATVAWPTEPPHFHSNPALKGSQKTSLRPHGRMPASRGTSSLNLGDHLGAWPLRGRLRHKGNEVALHQVVEGVGAAIDGLHVALDPADQREVRDTEPGGRG